MSTQTINHRVGQSPALGRQASANAARISIWLSLASLSFLAILHILSPEFDPSWRMISEYALGNYGWVLSLMFITGALSCWVLVLSLTVHVKTLGGKIGLFLLLLTGIGGAMASIFDVRQETMHGVAALIGVPTMPVAAILISLSLIHNPAFANSKRALLITANLTWMILVLMVVSLIILMNGLKQAGIAPGTVPKTLPAGLFAIDGWVNRLLVLINSIWSLTVAGKIIQMSRN
jgi:hypothetical protein